MRDTPGLHALAWEARWLPPDQVPLHQLAARWAPHALLRGTWKALPRCCCLLDLHAGLFCAESQHAGLRLLQRPQWDGKACLHRKGMM